jgi:hypothetical protein
VTLDVLLRPRSPRALSPASAASALFRLDDQAAPPDADADQDPWTQFSQVVVSCHSEVAAATTFATAFNGDPSLSPLRAVDALVQSSASLESSAERFSQFGAWAARVAASRFPRFVTLVSIEPAWRINGEVQQTLRRKVHPLIQRGLYAAAVAAIDRLIGEEKPARDPLQILMTLKGQLYFSLNQTPICVKLLDEAIALAPESESARRAMNAKLEVARLMEKRAPRPRAEARARTVPFQAISTRLPRDRSSRGLLPSILARRSVIGCLASISQGVGVRAAEGRRRE